MKKLKCLVAVCTLVLTIVGDSQAPQGHLAPPPETAKTQKHNH